jgi:hypothetical protein
MRFKQEAKLAFRTVNLKHMINPAYVVTNKNFILPKLNGASAWPNLLDQ